MASTASVWDEAGDWAEAEESVVRVKTARPDSAERRTARRLPLEIDVAVEGGACRFTTTTYDLSPGGMFLVTHEQIPIGTEVVLGFTLPSGAELEVIGLVQWRRSRGDVEAPQGMGISFFCLDPEVRKVLEQFCAVREPLYYEDVLAAV
jgi:uncharacterized protein (TIGR02266 family)